MADVLIAIQVCHAGPGRQRLIDLTVADGVTVAAAVQQAMPDIDLSQHRVGIFGKLKTPDTLVRAHDRIEIYRPLLTDPKEARRTRAKR